MTAQIVYHLERDDVISAIEAETITNQPQWPESGILGKFRGQLWERIAEGKHNPSVITPSQGARIGGVRNELGTRSGRTNVRGRLVCNAILNYRERHICPEPWSHGIIKGTRQATTEATRYVLTEDAPEARATYGLTSIDDE